MIENFVYRVFRCYQVFVVLTIQIVFDKNVITRLGIRFFILFGSWTKRKEKQGNN